ncbi:MAG: hypothetical protein AB1352_00825 [Patescibacteria group bacterium]
MSTTNEERASQLLGSRGGFERQSDVRRAQEARSAARRWLTRGGGSRREVKPNLTPSESSKSTRTNPGGVA